MAYQVSLDKFSGPLDLLLQLIEKNELDIIELSLVNITDEFVKYVETLEEIRPEELADFLVMSARLLFLKSNLLMPGLLDKEEEPDNLVSQLKIYREYFLASKTIQKILNKKNVAFNRDKFPSGLVQQSFRLKTKIMPETLKNYCENVLQVVVSQIKLAQKTLRKVISLKERVGQIIKLLSSQAELKVGSLFSNRAEAVVTFLAILELIKERHADADQPGLFEEITVTRCDLNLNN
ncbi:MAG: ScpA family protein [Patescibacteria group bacterium]|nr:ScpA family protein [Patescibacteria group bacterium]MDD5121647.1 ScpA family protein [Patescibacteria group bacterium]MDD5221899.1 ScpA family protein [Patescibacteria group bacterium]MDD5396189.1 ScpA family protein [Patescibacteria group bacterium]